MNIAKNMEAIFIIAVAMVTATGIATAAGNATNASNAPQRAAAVQVVQVVQAAGGSNMTVVNVTAKRLSAAEKAAL